MSNNNENNTSTRLSTGLVPKLRFPEFKDDGAWEVEEVGNVFEVTRGYVLSMNLVSEEQNESNPFPVYSSQTKNNGLAGYYKEFLYENAITWTTDGANAGDVNYRKGKFYCTNVCGVLLNKNGFANLCIAALINSVSRKHVSYVGNPKLMNGVMSKIKIPFPKIEEQQKISAFLSSLDEVITAESQKLELYKQHKKGLLQNLFPQEGDTSTGSARVPKLRFKEFEDSGEWEEKKLGEVLIKNSCKNKERNYTLVESVSNKYGFIKQDEYFEDRVVASKDTSNYYVVKKGYFAYNPSRIDVGSLAYKFEDNISIISPLYISFKANNELIDDIYLLNYFKSNVFRKQMIFEGGVRNTLNFENLSEIKIPFPSLPEQQKIAACLSSLDDLIQGQTEKIELLKQHKKGLLQGLFPNVNEETA